MRLLLVGNTGGTNVGGSFFRAAKELGLGVEILESDLAMGSSPWLRRFNWWYRGHRPPWLGSFSRMLVEKVSRMRPQWLIVTGLGPCNRDALRAVAELGARRINFLTDDPFNPRHRAPWFLDALPHYEEVFSPRRANMPDLSRVGCNSVSYLPFGYDPELHYPGTTLTPYEEGRFAADVMFAGGADVDRVPYVAALLSSGFRVGLYGDYWDRFAATRACSQGHADPETLRKATLAAKVSVCLVRRANRDGNTMRTFEIPAIGGCLLAEETTEHREIFGEEGTAAMYFRTVGEMVAKARWLLAHDDERRRLAGTAHRLVVAGRNTYKDRLAAMLSDRAVFTGVPPC